MANYSEEEKEAVKGLLKGSATIEFTARGRATAAAARTIEFTLEAPSPPNLLSDLASLEEQSAGQKTGTLKVIIGDDDSVCELFGLDKGSLTEGQAKILLTEVVDERKKHQKHKREMKKVWISAVGGFIAGVLAGIGMAKTWL